MSQLKDDLDRYIKEGVARVIQEGPDGPLLIGFNDPDSPYSQEQVVQYANLRWSAGAGLHASGRSGRASLPEALPGTDYYRSLKSQSISLDTQQGQDQVHEAQLVMLDQTVRAIMVNPKDARNRRTAYLGPEEQFQTLRKTLAKERGINLEE